MKLSPLQWIARARSVRLALEALAGLADHLLLILPSTHGALAFARELCDQRHCCVLEGPITASRVWHFAPVLRSASELAKAYAGQPELPCTVISFPDQLAGDGPSFAWLPFNGGLHAFSVIEALIVLRHRPPVFGLRTLSSTGDFLLSEIEYRDLLDANPGPLPLRNLMGRLLAPLESELAKPPADWLAAPWLAFKSEAQWRARVREELKEIECLLRLHLLSPGCDRLRAGTAVAALMARQKYLLGAASP